ncbi:putative MDIS1-interacting receptor like kinase 2 [Cocos nucifera]|uniref:non-specific serine/threonine protein kinase n=1 Tax=Cocos nucifera TaxID=13894 RepID=A0A8K0N8E2_COCNU|nr:putative MDIS1-interacting receptor like kinase 2 [Cocos nucifera]
MQLDWNHMQRHTSRPTCDHGGKSGPNGSGRNTECSQFLPPPSSLTSLNLTFNNLYGSIPPTIAALSKLTSLDLCANNFTGIIPLQISSLTKLNSLNLSDNQISGSVPAWLREIPKNLSKLTNLFNLNLSNNLLVGEACPKFGELSNLEVLDPSANRLRGRVPEQLGNCMKLRLLKLGNNQLSGSIALQIGNLVYLDGFLDLSYNSFTGEIPPSFGKLNRLQNLNPSHDKFTGHLPSSLCDMMSSSSIDLSYNELEGPLHNCRIFRNASVEWFIHNKGLCGAVKGLPSCGFSATSKCDSYKHHKLLLLITVPSLGILILLFLFVVFALLILRRKKRTRHAASIKEVESSIWNFNGEDAYNDIIEAIEDFDDDCCIGAGVYSSVYKALLPSGKLVAVKKFHPLEIENSPSKLTFWNEIRALTQIQHRNIVKLYGFCSSTQHKFLVHEYMERGSLANILPSEGAIELEWSRRVDAVKHVAYALSYMHHDCAPPLIHRDITSNNILFDSEYKACVSDFGIARLLKPDSSNWSMLAGT